jgi:hypothetical protein
VAVQNNLVLNDAAYNLDKHIVNDEAYNNGRHVKSGNPYAELHTLIYE